ncbi:hypothetical protein Dcar01_02412 [Deinococcus carri]|uniref:TtsA-like Glycoside hydrolase family 108 domain-containing protein n=1 Tax=Deinococcus carri TaxID=1211323 RepID=A0ABP9WC80_9DEIO
MSRFNDAFEIVIGHEGGYTADPRDRGNWTDGAFGQKGGTLKGTKYGVSAMSYPHLDIQHLTLEQARTIYKQNYWDRAGCDNLPGDLALCVFDTAVNSGVGRALSLLTTAKTPGDYLDARLRFLRSLPSWGTFGRGWQRRVDTLRRQAASWAATPHVDVSFPPTPTPAPTTSLYVQLRNPDGTLREDWVSVPVDSTGRVLVGSDRKPRAYYVTAALAATKGLA